MSFLLRSGSLPLYIPVFRILFPIAKLKWLLICAICVFLCRLFIADPYDRNPTVDFIRPPVEFFSPLHFLLDLVLVCFPSSWKTACLSLMCFPVKTKHMLFRLNHHMQHFYELNVSLCSLISASLPLVFAVVHAHVCLLFLSKTRAVTGTVIQYNL